MTIRNRIFLYKTAYKRHKRSIVIAGLLLLATSLSFALGYIAGRDGTRTPIVIDRCGLTHEQASR